MDFLPYAFAVFRSPPDKKSPRRAAARRGRKSNSSAVPPRFFQTMETLCRGLPSAADLTHPLLVPAYWFSNVEQGSSRGNISAASARPCLQPLTQPLYPLEHTAAFWLPPPDLRLFSYEIKLILPQYLQDFKSKSGFFYPFAFLSAFPASYQRSTK
jgi:hypothetical protein